MANVTLLVLMLAVALSVFWLAGKKKSRRVRDRREEILDRYRQSVIEEAEKKGRRDKGEKQEPKEK